MRDRLDTNEFELFLNKLKKSIVDQEDCDYILKRILRDLDNDDFYHNPELADKIMTVQSKLRVMLDQMNDLQTILKDVPMSYQELIFRHSKQLSQMTSYMAGVKSTHRYLSDQSHRDRQTVMTSTVLSPVTKMLKDTYQIERVVKMEK